MAGACEYCAHYVFDDETETYLCEIDLDEDEMERFLRGSETDCHYFSSYDEYDVVRHQN